MRYPRNVKLFTGQLDVAPFAGVFFLLVLFLLLHSYLVPPTGLRIQLPVSQSLSLPGTTTAALVVAVDGDGRLYFDHQIISESDLRARLAAKARHAREPLALLVQADEAVKLEAGVRLAGLAQQAGIREVWIATRPPLFPSGPPAKPAP